jgi:hypothetical protein
MPENFRMALEVRWVDDQPSGVVASSESTTDSLPFTGWLELAAAMRALTEPADTQ